MSCFKECKFEKKLSVVRDHFTVLRLYMHRSGNGWWWVPVIAPLVGGVLGAGIYTAMVELHHPPSSKQSCEGQVEEESAPLGKQENICADVCV